MGYLGLFAAALSFMAPQYVDETFPGGEPVLHVDTAHHTILYSAHEGATHLYRDGLASGQTLSWISEYRNQTKMWTSRDGGASFQRVDFGAGFAADPTRSGGWSDPDFSQDASGRIYNTGLNYAIQSLFSSADGGATWDRGTLVCSPGDRPWLAGGQAGEVFMATTDVDGDRVIYRSADGGNSCEPQPIASPGGFGKIHYDHVSERLVQPAQRGADLGLNVWRRGEPAATFRPALAADVFPLWPAAAIDGAGTVYLVWGDQPRAEGTAGGCGGSESPLPNRIQMVFTKDWGATWSAPVVIGAPANGFAFWPWIAAGDAGRVAVAWYETDRVVDVSCQPSAVSIRAATVLGADDAAGRTVEVVDAAGRPVSDGKPICTAGFSCNLDGTDRRLGDFFTTAIDERGCMVIASGDTMRKDPVTGGERAVALPIFIRQASGPRLIGSGDCSGAAAAPAAPAAAATPPAAGVPLPSARRCTSRRRFEIRLRAPRGQRLRSAKVYVNGKRAKVRRRGGRLTATIDLRRLRKGRYTVRVVAVTGQGRTVTSQRRYRTCRPKRR